MRAFERVDEAILGRAPPRLFALDHVADVLLHDRHRPQQLARFVAAAFRDRRLQLALGNTIGNPGRVPQRLNDAPDQDDGNDPG